MIQTSDRIVKHKISLLSLADELGNISKACKMTGVTRDTFYRYRGAVNSDGVEALLDNPLRTPNNENRVEPAHGQVRVSNELRRKGVGRVYQQIHVDTYSKVSQCKRYTTKAPITQGDDASEKQATKRTCAMIVYCCSPWPVLCILTDRDEA